MLDKRNCFYTEVLIKRSVKTKYLQTIVPFLGAMVFLLSCSNSLEEVKKFEEKDEFPSEIAKDVHLLYSDSAQLVVKLDAPEILRFKSKNPTTEFPKGLHVWFYNALGVVNSELQAEYALKFEKDGLTELRNNVVATNEKGEVLETELLIWDEKAGRIYTPAFVKISSGEEVIYGEGLEADERMEEYQIKNTQIHYLLHSFYI